jgi:VCBS repeat-containing protein
VSLKAVTSAMTAADQATITITATQDPAVAQPDEVSTPENEVLNGDLFADNGNGIDRDPDGEAVAISEVNGQAANVGATITLTSGAKLTVNADGTFSYDPNGKFNALTDNSSGAANTSAEDSFTYRLATGNVTTVTVTVNGVAGVNDQLRGNAGDNTITGTPQGNVFLLGDGGDDTVAGLAGDDLFSFRGAMTAADRVDGGSGTDTVALLGDYSGGLVLGGSSLTGVERIGLYSSATIGAPGPFSYKITTHDANVASGESLFVTAAGLQANETLSFNGSAETDGSFRVQGGAGADQIIGGEKGDYLIGNGGNDQLFGRGGDDTLVGGAGQDLLRGGHGFDTFRFLAASDSTVAAPDTIADFQFGEKIDLSAIDANSLEDGDQAFTFIGDAAFTGAGQLRATYDANTKLWSVEGDIDGNGQADFLILVSRPGGAQPIVAEEFFL